MAFPQLAGQTDLGPAGHVIARYLYLAVIIDLHELQQNEP